MKWEVGATFKTKDGFEGVVAGIVGSQARKHVKIGWAVTAADPIAPGRIGEGLIPLLEAELLVKAGHWIDSTPRKA